MALPEPTINIPEAVWKVAIGSPIDNLDGTLMFKPRITFPQMGHEPETRRNTMPLFEVAAIRIPTVVEAEQGRGEELVMAPKAIVAKDERAAIAQAFAKYQGGSAGSGETLEADRLQVLIRPFG